MRSLVLVKLPFPAIPAVLGCKDNYYYRNKMEFSFTDRRWLTDEEVKQGTEFEHRNGLGFHVPGNFWGVLDVQHCYLQADPSNKIRLAVKEFALQHGYTFFNLQKQFGMLRNLMVRNTSIGELLVLVSFSSENDEEKIENLMQFIGATFPEITTLQYVYNPKRNDTIFYDLEPVVYKGNDHIVEQLANYRFKIGPKSFFQTNSVQAKVLYDITKEFC